MTYELALMEREELGEERGRFELVKNLLNVGTPLEYIIKATGWSEEKLLEFKKSQLIHKIVNLWRLSLHDLRIGINGT